MQAEKCQRRWATLSGAEQYSGIGERTLRAAINAGTLRSALVLLKDGNRRGKRLIDLRSLDQWIEAHVGGTADLPHLIDANKKSVEVTRAKAAARRRRSA